MTFEKTRINTLRALLLAHWDPIGIANVPAAADEYDVYVSELQKLLAKDASVADIAEALLTIETVQMGLPGNRDRGRRVAELLVAESRV